MEEMSKHGQVGRAARRADMDRKTARTYLDAGVMPSATKTARTWRTREDPFAPERERIVALLREHPAMEARTLFDMLCAERAAPFAPGQLRTLQRLVRRWRAQHDERSQLAMLAQRHRPGEAAQTDFTHLAALQVTIAGVLCTRLLGVFVLPFSNWMWVTLCLSESLLSIRRTVQRALFQLGRVPQFHQTDNSTGATHRLDATAAADGVRRKRPFNAEYAALMDHFGMTPRTIEVGESHQNGDVEAANGAIKRALAQALLVRGSADFASVEALQHFLDALVRARNTARGARVREELDAMRVLAVDRLVEYVEERVRVSAWSTIFVRQNTYSVPARLIREELVVRVYEDRLDVFFAGALELTCPRAIGHAQPRIDYRHVVWSLLRKPGGFARYVYREEMFPTLLFRRAYDALDAQLAGVARDVAYLRILHLAASTLQSEVEAALALLFEQREVITPERVTALVTQRLRPTPPALAALTPDLAEYDRLLTAVGA